MMETVLSGTILNGRYRVERALGSGGFGHVYLAVELTTQQQYAIKEYLVTGPTGQEQRRHEANVLSQVHHPHIPAFHDAFSERGRYYVVLNYIEGNDLTDIIRSANRRGELVPLPRIMGWVFAICDAVDFLHSRRPPVIHRNIKPDNIRIMPNGTAMLIDLGDAKVAYGGRTLYFIRHHGTPGYAPPEQYPGGSGTDARSDVYALGGTLFFALTTHEPPSVSARNQAIQQGLADLPTLRDQLTKNPHPTNPQVDPIRQFRLGVTKPGKPAPRHSYHLAQLGTLPPELLTQLNLIIQKAMAMKPKDRYQSVAEFSNDLQKGMGALSTSTSLAPSHALQLEESPRTQPSVQLLGKDDILVPLSISAAEALHGTTRQVMPQEQEDPITVSVPPNAYEGLIIPLAGKGEKSNLFSREGTLFVRIHIEQEEAVSSPVHVEQEETIGSSDLGQRETFWPTCEDYDLAMMNLSSAAVDPELRTGKVAQGELGIIHYGGTNPCTAIYRVTTVPSPYNPSGDWVIRCFCSTFDKQPPDDIRERYSYISEFYTENFTRVSALLAVVYVEQGIRVDYIDRDTAKVMSEVLPIVKIPFISARSLGSFVAERHRNREIMELLCAVWLRMIRELEAARMAHGDLDLTNVLVVQEGSNLTLKLIDYDSVWIPAFEKYPPPREAGHEPFQHPAFFWLGSRPYNAEMDRFSALVIYISLRALSLHPDLYEAWGADDSNRLLFSRQDYEAEMQQTRASTGYVSRIAQLRQMGIGVLAPYLDELSYALWNRRMPCRLDEISLPSAIHDIELLEKIDSPSSLTSYVSSTEAILPSPTITYEIFLVTFPSSPLTIGRTLEVSLYLSHSSDNDNTTGYRFELPRNEAVGGELNLLLTALGFQFNGENVASLPIEVPLEGEIAPSPQVARFMLVALRPGTAKVSAEVYKGSDFLTNLEEEVQVLGLVGLEGIDEDYRLSSSSNPIRSRPVPQPDLILQVQTEWNVDASVCKFWYVLNSFHRSSSIRGGSYRSPSLSAGWVERSQRLLGSMLEECAGGQPEDMRARLASFGYSLFQSVFPLVLQNELRNLVRSERMLTLLILADQDAWLPWEVLHTGQAFLGEQFVIGRWMRELDEARPYEFPVGGVHVAHYANVPQPEVWVDLLTFPDIPEPLLLPVFADLEAAEAMRGLHLIRYGHSSGPLDLHDAPMMLDMAKSNGSVEAELRPAKLSLRRNRPLVSLGYVSAGQPELTGLEQAWAPTFVRAGCSAFVGPMWAVQPTVQAAFVSGFYSRLWAGDSLAGALHMGRRLAKAAAPDSLDWLAYVLFGDPMARPYRPVQGQGYALVEPIGREMDDPVPAGGSARFRVSLRRTPPVWHEERVIEVAETLNFGNLQVYVVTFGLEVIPSPPIAMKKLTPDGDYLGWFNLSVPPDITAKEVRVQVHFVDGMHPVHSLAFPLKLATRGGDIR